MEKILQQILEEQKKTNTRLEAIEGRLDNIEGNLAENTRFIHALSQDEHVQQPKRILLL
ncbi:MULTISPECIES: hypothetical protein [Pelosinus]|jgi:hypothetical protein|uniref:hypothetical protein n=1 Tax=Pelosinus TaxID=365348 RepID=UPI0002E9A271|nr:MULTISPECIES: hypothetical protein [Pelosinus]